MSLQRDVARLAAQGRTCSQIARALNASVSVVRELMPAPVVARPPETVAAMPEVVPASAVPAAPAPTPEPCLPPRKLFGGHTGRPVSDAGLRQRERIAEEFAKPDGLQTEALSRELGISEPHIRRLAHKLGLSRHPDWAVERRPAPRKGGGIAGPEGGGAAVELQALTSLPAPPPWGWGDDAGSDDLDPNDRLAAADDAVPGGEDPDLPAPRSRSDAPRAGKWPEDSPRFQDVDRLHLLRETVWPNYRYLPSPAMRTSGCGSSLGGF